VCQRRAVNPPPCGHLAICVGIRHIVGMLDLPGQPVLDKQALIGGCVRLALRVDDQRLAAEVAALPADCWDVRGGRSRYPRQGVHHAAQTVFLRGQAPAEGDLPIEDRPVLDRLPYVRQLIERDIGSLPQRCLLARLPAGGSVTPHIDRAPYFSKTLRLHVPVESHDRVWMICDGLAYLMKPSEVWVLNNTTVHGVWNAHATLSRTHLICDFLPDPQMLDRLAKGERGLGSPMPAARQHFAALAQAASEA
jgi:hypothetical protein